MNFGFEPKNTKNESSSQPSIDYCYLCREYGENETLCWMERVNVFVVETLSPTIQACIQSYAQEYEYEEETDTAGDLLY